MLSHSKTACELIGDAVFFTKQMTLTSRNDNPREVKSHVIDPIVQELWPTVRDVLVAVVERASAIVQRDSEEMADAHDQLKRVPKPTPANDAHYNNSTQRSPEELSLGQLCSQGHVVRSCGSLGPNGCLLTTVIVSIQSMNASDVMYLESDRAYSFHSCANKSCRPASESC